MKTKVPTVEKTTKAITKSPTRAIIKSKKTTSIKIKFDVGLGNTLSLRGQGANLSWDKGTFIKNIKNDEWIFETDLDFSEIEFKTLINDSTFEVGENHLIKHGQKLTFYPKFQ